MSADNKQQNSFADCITLYMNSFLCKGNNNFKKGEIEKALDNIPSNHIFWYPDGTLQIFGECFIKSFEASSFVRNIRNEGFQFIQNYRTHGS
jgi:hypothetical protein